MTEIERFICGEGYIPLVDKVDFRDGTLTVGIVAAERPELAILLTFHEAVPTSVWLDHQEPVEWPLNLICFDCVRDPDCWRFVLNASEIELGWRSRWPSKGPRT